MINKVKLGDVCDLSIGFVGTVTSQYEDGGIPFFRTLNIKPYKIDDDDLKRITLDFHESQKKSQLREGDIAMVHTGVPGICCVIPKEYDNSNCIDMIVIKPHNEKVDAYYLAAYMNTIGYKHIERQQVGCIQKHFNLKDAVELEVFLPDIAVQKKIGAFVKNLNKRIDLNESIMDKIDSFIKMLYDYWFLQFEFPNSEGKAYKSNGGSVVWNEFLKKDIPEGWYVGKFKDLLDTLECGNRPSGGVKDLEEGIPSIGAENVIEIGKYDFGSEKYISNDYFSTMKKGIVKSGDILLYKDGAGVGASSMAKNGFPHELCAVNSHVFILRSKDNNLYQNYLYYSLHKNYIKKLLVSLAMKAAQPGLNQPSVESIPIIIPCKDVLERFNESVNDMIDMIILLAKQNREMEVMRDEFLPLLLNGQVKM